MNFIKIKSYAKINLSLNVIKRLTNKYHEIESLVTFINLFDEIKIKKSKLHKHNISFFGKFSNGIKKDSTVHNLLNLLDKEKKIKNQKFEIKIKKNIPQKSGMGGGSMNAASILKYFIDKKIIIISPKKIYKLAQKIGSDVPLGLERKNSLLLKNGAIKRLKKKFNFYVLIVKPNFGCSTKNIYNGLKKYSGPLFIKSNKFSLNSKNLAKSVNDLETVVFKKYPKIKSLKNFLLALPDVIFVRMTGSGSALVAYFNSKKVLNKAVGIFKKKYKNYWYITSKTI